MPRKGWGCFCYDARELESTGRKLSVGNIFVAGWVSVSVQRVSQRGRVSSTLSFFWSWGSRLTFITPLFNRAIAKLVNLSEQISEKNSSVSPQNSMHELENCSRAEKYYEKKLIILQIPSSDARIRRGGRRSHQKSSRVKRDRFKSNVSSYRKKSKNVRQPICFERVSACRWKNGNFLHISKVIVSFWDVIPLWTRDYMLEWEESFQSSTLTIDTWSDEGSAQAWTHRSCWRLSIWLTLMTSVAIVRSKIVK